MSGIQPFETQTLGLPCSNGAHVLHFESRSMEPTQAPAGTTETDDTTAFRLRLNSLTPDELSEELDRRTKEAQRLQEEVEIATKAALQKFCSTYGISSLPGENPLNHSDQGGDFTVPPIHQQAVTLPLGCGINSVNQEVSQRQVSSPEKEMLEIGVNDCLQQLSDFHLSKTQNLPEQETFSFEKVITNLQTKLHKAQMERDALSDLRLEDSKKHADQMEKMLHMLEELQNIKRTADQKLQETEDEALVLNGKLSPAPKLTDDFNNETDEQHMKQFLSTEHFESEECYGINKQNQRMGDLIVSLGQEMALLMDKLTSSNYSSICLSDKLELLKKLADRQTSLHQCQVNELESTLSSYKDKVSFLEQQLLQFQSQMVDAERKREQSLQQAEELQSQLGQMKRCFEQQLCELQVEVKARRGQLDEVREQLHRNREEKNCLQALLDERAMEGRRSQELLQEKDKELLLRKREAQQHLSWLDEAQSRCQTLQVDGETLRLKLNDREKEIMMLRLQMESSVQMHSRTIDSLHQENSLLSHQLNLHKQEIQQLRAEIAQKKSDLANAEHERQKLQVSVSEQSRRAQEETLEKQQLTNQLEIQRMQLLTLTEEHKELQRLHCCKNAEHKGVVLRLHSQLRNTYDELEQVKSTLRTLGGADGHGLQVAMDMQKEITARRELADSLQGKIQQLEETLEKLYQEKHYQSLESQRQLQEFAFVKEEKKQLANELGILRSKDKKLRHWIGQLEAILHKMTENFADCQDFIQLQEQEFYRLKLQHALDLKELQTQNLCTGLSVPPPELTPSAIAVPDSSQHAFTTQIKSMRQQECPTLELQSVVRELQGVISENHRPHTDNSAAGNCFHRRRSAPEGVHRTAFTNKGVEVKDDSRYRRKTCGSKPHFLMSAELNEEIMNNKSFSEKIMTYPGRAASSRETAVKVTSSPQYLSLGRRSPVHALLTSDPNSCHDSLQQT
ncbi:coiled-coil domain-containing protein 158-like isoform X2 [Echeneis naucrates]|uniref:coiled-coil domain-containing protein 158-like isoform X2 n=1 Tax=Echeneis naucrates TaxID=173247 RepID=UPI001114661A|nr:coiled-coil domain-containing protein 158-like isoform X2 [Echeneis naucrates]